MTTVSEKTLKSRLQDIINTEPDSIRAAVANEAAYEEDIASFFSNLLQYGCVSGMVGSLCYYVDTRNFFDKHYHEIEELREDWEDSLGEPLKIDGDLKNALAWFAFKRTAYQMALELGLEE